MTVSSNGSSSGNGSISISSRKGSNASEGDSDGGSIMLSKDSSTCTSSAIDDISELPIDV